MGPLELCVLGIGPGNGPGRLWMVADELIGGRRNHAAGHL